jgi:hypothetical protein
MYIFYEIKFKIKRSNLMEKKPWITPELIVLVRSMPEEAVLYGCKFTLAAELTGPATQAYGKCDSVTFCEKCSRIVQS